MAFTDPPSEYILQFASAFQRRQFLELITVLQGHVEVWCPDVCSDIIPATRPAPLHPQQFGAPSCVQVLCLVFALCGMPSAVPTGLTSVFSWPHQILLPPHHCLQPHGLEGDTPYQMWAMGHGPWAMGHGQKREVVLFVTLALTLRPTGSEYWAQAVGVGNLHAIFNIA